MLAAATLVFAQGAPALAEDVPTAKNPGWPEACGVDIVMVFDTSNSILPDDGADMEAAGKSFVDSLTGTPSRVAVTYFRGIDGLGGNGVGGTQIGWTDISNTSGANAVKGAIDSFGNWGNWEAQGGTNWEDGFNTTDGFGADIVLFMTDGNPTTYNNNPDDLGSDVDAIDIDKGVAQANDTKSQGTRVVAVGIGSNISVTNLQRISGPTVNDDYFLADGFDDLANILPEIALELCQGTVTVKKLVDGKPAAGWTFNATDQATKITGNDGLVNFDWSQSSGQSLEVTITEIRQRRL